MTCTKFQVSRSKTVTGSFWTDGPKQDKDKPGRNQNTSPGSVLVSKQYQFVIQCWLANITGLFRVQVSGKVLGSPPAFQSVQAGYENP